MPDRLWTDAEVFVLGGGPSMRLVDHTRLKGRRVIAVNNAYKLGQWDAMYYGDRHWILSHGRGLVDFAGLKVTTCEAHMGRPGIKVMRKRNAPHGGISWDRGTLAWCLSSGATAINLASLLGAKRIVLFGFDMRKVPVCIECGSILDGPGPCTHQQPEHRSNFHDDYGVRKPSYNPWKRMKRVFPRIKEELERRHVEIVNATPRSAIEGIPIVPIEEVLP